MSWYIWLMLAGVFLIFEALTVGFLIFWLSIGALLTMIVSLFTKNLIIQMSVFVLSSTILIFATKPFVKKIAKNETSLKTNVYSIIGKVGIVIQEINSIDSTGQIKVGGEVWSATCKNDMTIPNGTEVEVLDIKGVKTIVTPIKTISNN